MGPYVLVRLIESSHDLNNQTNNKSSDVFMAKWSEHKIGDLRMACKPQFKSQGFPFFCIDIYKNMDVATGRPCQ